jgi:DNA-binding response OmpR family regulator
MARVLLVEGDAHCLERYGLEIAGEGHEVIKARNGREALGRLRSQEPDLVVLDPSFPDEDGLELLRRMVQARKATKFILHAPNASYRQDLSCWAADAYLVETQDLGPLKKAIRKLMSPSALQAGVGS